MNLPPSELITLPEGTTLEFKQDVSTPKNILKAIVPHINTAGWVFFIGVEDNSREIVGVREPLAKQEQPCNLMADSIATGRVPDVGHVSSSDTILRNDCPYPGDRRRLFIKRKGLHRVREALGYVGLNHCPTIMYDFLQPAMSFGFAQMTEANPTKSTTQKYRLSPKEKRFLTLNNLENAS